MLKQGHINCILYHVSLNFFSELYPENSSLRRATLRYQPGM